MSENLPYKRINIKSLTNLSFREASPITTIVNSKPYSYVAEYFTVSTGGLVAHIPAFGWEGIEGQDERDTARGVRELLKEFIEKYKSEGKDLPDAFD